MWTAWQVNRCTQRLYVFCNDLILCVGNETSNFQLSMLKMAKTLLKIQIDCFKRKSKRSREQEPSSNLIENCLSRLGLSRLGLSQKIRVTREWRMAAKKATVFMNEKNIKCISIKYDGEWWYIDTYTKHKHR